MTQACKATPPRLVKQRISPGFTLIELMITVAIIGVLAAIGLPSYSQYVVRSNRAAAQAEMMDIANRQQQFLLANRTYATTIAALGYTLPSAVSSKYNTPTITASSVLNASCVVEADTGAAPSYVMEFEPISSGSQAGDGTLSLTSAGVKCPAGKW